MILQDPVKAKPQAELSLRINPKQKHVLIDLATAEWLLGNFEASSKNAAAASEIDAQLPGPHLLLALLALEKNDLKIAAKKADEATSLGKNHPYYITIQAAVAEANGDSATADRLFAEAWQGNPPSLEQFQKWYTKHRPLALIARIRNRK